MADLAYSTIKINDIEVSLDAPTTESIFTKLGGAINFLLDKNFTAIPFTAAGAALWVPPVGLTDVMILGCGGGGGGSSGGNGNDGNTSGFGGVGGRGAIPQLIHAKVTAGNTYTINVGSGGAGGAKSAGNNSIGQVGGNGGATTITGTDLNCLFYGARGGGLPQPAVYAPNIFGTGSHLVTPATTGVLAENHPTEGGWLIGAAGGGGGDKALNGNIGGDGGICMFNTLVQTGGGKHATGGVDAGGSGGGAGGNSLGLGGYGGHGGHGLQAAITINSAVRVANVVTLTFTSAFYTGTATTQRNFHVGEYIKVDGIDAGFIGRYEIIDTPAPNKISYASVGADGAAVDQIGQIWTADNIVNAYAINQTYESCNGGNGILGSGGGGGGSGGAGYAGNYTRGAKGGNGGAGFIYIIALVTP